MPTENTPQEPFTKIYLCPECGYWLATNTLLEAFAAISGSITRICPHDNAALAHVQPEDRLQLRELPTMGEAVK